MDQQGQRILCFACRAQSGRHEAVTNCDRFPEAPRPQIYATRLHPGRRRYALWRAVEINVAKSEAFDPIDKIPAHQSTQALAIINVHGRHQHDDQVQGSTKIWRWHPSPCGPSTTSEAPPHLVQYFFSISLGPYFSISSESASLCSPYACMRVEIARGISR